MPPISFSLANSADDAGLRALLRENPLPGSIQLSFEREPSFFRAAAIEGPFHQTIVARAGDCGPIVGMGGRAVRSLFVGCISQPVGYMSQLRVDQRYRWGAGLARVIGQGFAFYRQLHEDGRAPFYLLSIVADNRMAQRLLSAGLPAFPQLVPYARLHTFALYAGHHKSPLPLPQDVTLVHGAAAYTAALVDCLQRNGMRKEFSPVWTAKTLFDPAHTPGLKADDFVLAVAGEKVVGCLALWDQSAYKQMVVRGYSGALARWRPFFNLMARVGGWPVLPPPGTPIRHGYASHLAVDGDDPIVFAALLRSTYQEAHVRAYSYLLLGLDEHNPLCAVVQSYRTLCYDSHIYLATWDDGLAALPPATENPTGIEVALL